MADEKRFSVLELSADRRAKYRAALAKAGAWTNCSRCGSPPSSLGIAPAQHPVSLFHLHEAIRGVPEQRIDSVVVMCLHCGAMYFHAAQALDDHLPDEGQEDD